jgi:hypothetical protein
MDACVVLYKSCLVGEIYVVIKKRFFGGYESTEEGYQFKASIAWDHPCFLFTFNTFNSCACVYLVTTKDILAFVSYTLTPWDIALGSIYASAQDK